jgi:putative transposase
MPRKKKVVSESDRLLDELLSKCKSPEDILGKHGLIDQLRKRAVERALNGELTAHLGYEPHERGEGRRGNTRNGTSAKQVLTQDGSLELAVPRDRDGSFEPQLVRKGQRRLQRMDQQIIALYARGLTTREIQGHLEELYEVEVSPALISNVTAEVAEDAQAWRSRELEGFYPIVYFDALFVKSREGGRASNRAVYLALAIKLSGEKELLGMWLNDSEGAKFWLSIFTELQNRGMRDCLVACVDGLKGFEEALQAVFPRTQAQLCIVHKVRSSMRYVPVRQRKAVAGDLRAIYTAPTLSAAQAALERFAERWDGQYPLVSQSWRRDWALLTTFLDYPLEIRKVLYTTNAIESLNYSLRRVLKNRGAFPDDASVIKVLYLAIERAAKKWTMPLQNWGAALNRFAIMFPDRMPV